MGMMNKRDRYGWMAVFLHWLLFLLLVGLIAGGKYSASLPQAEKIGVLLTGHQQVGIAVFVLMAFRLLWKLINPGVTSLSESGLMNLLAGLVHWGLYAAVLGQALIGVAMVQAFGRDVLFADALLLPPVHDYLAFLPADAKVLREWHHYGFYAIAGLVGLHFVGAIFHRFSHIDALRRMWFGFKPSAAKDIPLE